MSEHPPGVSRDPDLHARLEAAYAARGPDYAPRTHLLGPDGRLLLGVDLVKDTAVLEAAYDDAAGVTREFNRNVLRVVNRGLGGDFRPEAFRHRLGFVARHPLERAGEDHDLAGDRAGGRHRLQRLRRHLRQKPVEQILIMRLSEEIGQRLDHRRPDAVDRVECLPLG